MRFWTAPPAPPAPAPPAQPTPSLLSDSDLIQTMLMRDAKKKDATQTKKQEDEKHGKAPVAAAANPDGDAAEPKPSRPEDGPFEDGDQEEDDQLCLVRRPSE